MKTPTLPDWYTNPITEDTSKLPRRSKKSAGLAVRRALGSFGEALAHQLSGIKPPESWLSKINPQAKIPGILILIIGATLIHGLVPLSIMLLSGILITLSAKVSIRQLGRVWVGIPLFSMAIVLPAVFSAVTPGTPVFTIWHLSSEMKIGPWHLPETLSVTSSGLLVATRFILRTTACVTFASLLTATTEQSSLINGLRRLGVPRVFSITLSMMQRYLAVLLQSAEEIHKAKLSRTIDGSSIRREQRWVAAGIGSLYRKTSRLAEEIHEAMISRGYNGDIRIRLKGRSSAGDIVWLAMTALFAAAIVIADRMIMT